MAEQHPMLAGIYDGWAGYQAHLVKALTPLNAAQLELRAAPHLRSIRQITTHMVAARARWLYNALNEGDATINEIGRWDRPDAAPSSPASLVEGLERTWQVLQTALARWTPTDLITPIVEEWQGETVTLERPWVIWHLIEHDLHHGGELSFSLGMHGLAAPDI